MKAFRISFCENWNDSHYPGSGLARMVLHFARPFFSLEAKPGAGNGAADEFLVRGRLKQGRNFLQ
jgi:hypothetical protein